MTRLRTTVFAALTCAALPFGALAEGDPKPGLLDIFTPDGIANSLASVAISALRTVMEVEYAHLETDVMRGRVTLSGVVLRPQLPYDRARQCEISLQRLSFDIGQYRFGLPAANISATAIGASGSIACLEREMGLALRTAGYGAIDIDRLTLEMDYLHTSGEIRSLASATVNDMATVDLAFSGAILPRLDSRGGPGDPAIRLRRAVLGLEDHGGWARLSRLMPENLRDPEVIRAMGTEGLTGMLSQNGTRALTATERRFVDDLMKHVAEFVRAPGEITVEAALPEDGIVIEPEVYSAPEQLLQALAPEARSAPRAQSELLDLTLFRENARDLTAEERLALARALLNGQGLPRAEAMVPEILAPIAGPDTPEGAEAALLTARALMPFDAGAAYPFALVASQAQLPEAVPMLDALEARMTTGAVIDAQARFVGRLDTPSGAQALPEDGDVRAVRRLALAHFTGLGAARSYQLAYYYALIAEAAGDIGAETLREDIEARFAYRGTEVADRWKLLRAELQESALSDWIDLDLAKRFLKDG